MNKRLRRSGIALVLLVALLTFGLWYLERPIVLEPSPDWEASVDSPDILRDQIYVDVDGATIEAEVLVPNGGAERKPAIVFTTGSGHNIVQGYAPGFLETFFQDVMLPRDMILVYANKRGMGGSTGSHYDNTLEGRAADIYSIVEALRTRPDIDPARIGVAGHSQGGWVVTILAATRPDLAFMIDFMGPVRSTWDQFLHFHEQMRSCEGKGPGRIRREMAWKRASTRVANAIGRIYPAGQIGFDSWYFDFDPTPLLNQIKVPSLFVYGTHDALVDAEANSRALNAAFPDSLPDHLRLLILPGANHGGFLTDDLCARYRNGPLLEPSPELIAGLGEFLDAQGILAR